MSDPCYLEDAIGQVRVHHVDVAHLLGFPPGNREPVANLKLFNNRPQSTCVGDDSGSRTRRQDLNSLCNVDWAAS